MPRKIRKNIMLSNFSRKNENQSIMLTTRFSRNLAAAYLFLDIL